MIPFEKETKKDTLFRRLRELADSQPYLSFYQIQLAAKEDKLIKSESTLKDYLGEAVDKGVLHDAGRGWYTRNAKPASLDNATVREIKEALTKRFPLLPHYLWSPLQFNPWLHHQLGRSPTFAYVDSDGIGDMAYFLRNEGWEVAVSPGKHDPSPGRGSRSVVLRGIRREIAENEPTIETALVDLFVENNRFQLMDAAEFHEMAHKLLAQHQVDLAGILRKLGDRKIKISDFITKEAADYLGIL
jgi:hypothetical protein